MPVSSAIPVTRVTFTEISLYEESEHYFHFRGLPNEEMTLILYIKNRPVNTDEDVRSLEELKTTIEVSEASSSGWFFQSENQASEGFSRAASC